jgi:hypothetical protein
MKKVTFYQEENELTYELSKGGSIETLIGNFYEVVSDFKDSNAKLFNFSSPILLRVENVNEENETDLIMNTGLALKQLQQKCKLTWTKKGRVRFKNNVSICVRATQRQIKTFTIKQFEELNDKLG